MEQNGNDVHIYHDVKIFGHIDAEQGKVVSRSSTMMNNYSINHDFHANMNDHNLKGSIAFSVDQTEKQTIHLNNYTLYQYKDTCICLTWIPQSCLIKQPLPEKLYLQEDECIIRGYAMLPSSMRYYDVSGDTNFTISIQILPCIFNLVELNRVRPTMHGSVESFSITTKPDDITIWMDRNYEQSYRQLFCIKSPILTINMNCYLQHWLSDSMIEFRYIVDDQSFEMLRTHYADEQEHSLFTQFVIPAKSSWFYSMGHIYQGWLSESTENWRIGSISSFPVSSNQIQLYRKSFSLHLESISDAYQIDIRFLFGIVVFINQMEVFRTGIQGNCTDETVSIHEYDQLMYRSISLPSHYLFNQPLFIEGINTIGIAVFAPNLSQILSYFDCILHFIEPTHSRHLDAELSSEGLSSTWLSMVDGVMSTFSSNMDSISSNYISVKFKKNRKEWINCVYLRNSCLNFEPAPQIFQIFGVSEIDQKLVFLDSYSSLSWNHVCEEKRIFINNTNSYNKYIIKNILIKSLIINKWILSEISFGIYNWTKSLTIFSYPWSIININEKSIIKPYYSMLTHYSIQPKLPDQFFFDDTSGILTIIPYYYHKQSIFTITAKSFTGKQMMTYLSLEICHCKNDYKHVEFYIEGKSEGSEIMITIIHLPDHIIITHQFHYENTFSLLKTLCLESGEYELHVTKLRILQDLTIVNYWAVTNRKEFPFLSGRISFINGDELTKIVQFSFIPIFLSNTRHLRYSYFTEPFWNEPHFDDSDWRIASLSQLRMNSTITSLYIRIYLSPIITPHSLIHLFVSSLSDIEIYHNQLLIMSSDPEWTSSSSSSSSTTTTTTSSFKAVIWETYFATIWNSLEKGGILGIHLFKPRSTTSLLDLNALLFHHSNTPLYRTPKMVRQSSIRFSNSFGLFSYRHIFIELKWNTNNTTVFEWEMNESTGAQFSGYSFVLSTITFISWSFIGINQSETGSEEIIIDQKRNYFWNSTEPKYFRTIFGFSSFRSFRLILSNSSVMNISICNFLFVFIHPLQPACQGIDEFPAVSYNEYSSNDCGYYYYGYKRRLCMYGQWTNIIMDHCIVRKPDNIRYSKKQYVFVQFSKWLIDSPMYEGRIEWYICEKGCNDEIKLNESNGELSGRVLNILMNHTIIITTVTKGFKNSVSIMMTVMNAKCPELYDMKERTVGDLVSIVCDEIRFQIGVHMIECIVTDDYIIKWIELKNTCMTHKQIIIWLIIILGGILGFLFLFIICIICFVRVKRIKQFH